MSDIREHVLTKWGERRSRHGPGDRFRQRMRKAPGTARDDLAALRLRFDTNGDGKLTGTELTGFKVIKTNPDGSLTAVTLASLGITQINLTEDTTHFEMPDRSAITGQGSSLARPEFTGQLNRRGA